MTELSKEDLIELAKNTIVFAERSQTSLATHHSGQRTSPVVTGNVAAVLLKNSMQHLAMKELFNHEATRTILVELGEGAISISEQAQGRLPQREDGIRPEITGPLAGVLLQAALTYPRIAEILLPEKRKQFFMS